MIVIITVESDKGIASRNQKCKWFLLTTKVRTLAITSCNWTKTKIRQEETKVTNCIWLLNSTQPTASSTALKPWPNGLANTEKQVENLGLLATPFDQALRGLALTWGDQRSLWSISNLHASRRNFFTVWPPNPNVSWPIISQWNTGYVCLEMGFLRLGCTSEEPCESVWPPTASIFASSTCGYLRPLTSPFGQGLKGNGTFKSNEYTIVV